MVENKVLLLGHNGMLGHMVYNYLRQYYHGFHPQMPHIETITVEGRFPDKHFLEEIKNTECDYIINCIGAIHQRTNDFKVNYDLPIWLEKNTTASIIHPGTDCEMDDDEYGVSKKKASDFIMNEGNHTKIIKTSIIGPERGTQASLLEWFLHSEGEVYGYGDAYWNGNTTLQWSEICFDMICEWEKYDVMNIIGTPTVSKYELLNTIKDIYEKDIIITNKENIGIDKSLEMTIETPPIREQLKKLKNFTECLRVH